MRCSRCSRRNAGDHGDPRSGFEATSIREAKLAAFALTALAFQRNVQAQAVPTATRRYDLSAGFGGSEWCLHRAGRRKEPQHLPRQVSIWVFVGIFGVRPRHLKFAGCTPWTAVAWTTNGTFWVGSWKRSKAYGRLTPYGDALFGRGEIKYINGYIDPTGTVEYLENPTNVLSGGGGVDFRVTDRFSVKADAQIQRYNTPVTMTGHLYSKPLTLAVVYHFSFGHFPTR